MTTSTPARSRAASFAFAFFAFAAASARADITPWSASPAPEWTAMFTRTSGWTGADGVYTYPLSGDDSLGSGALPGAKTFWIFSDTFVGNVRKDGSRADGTVMVHNTSGLMDGATPGAGAMQFDIRVDGTDAPIAMVSPPQADMWIWPNDGLVQDGTVYMTGLREKTGTGGAFNFATDGMVWLTASANDEVPFLGEYTVTDAPWLYAPARGAHGDITFGSAVMPLTTTAHAPFPDGYVYLYGVRNDPGSKKLLVARVKAQSLLDAAAYRYWDGAKWNRDIGKVKPVADRMASEFSVTPLPDGRYLNVFQLDALGTTIAVRYAPTPVGPWGEAIPIYDCPDTDLGKNVITYGAKAHPHLSPAGRLLISYHVNSLSFGQNLKHADIYHPRFVTVPLD